GNRIGKEDRLDILRRDGGVLEGIGHRLFGQRTDAAIRILAEARHPDAGDCHTFSVWHADSSLSCAGNVDSRFLSIDRSLKTRHVDCCAIPTRRYCAIASPTTPLRFRMRRAPARLRTSLVPSSINEARASRNSFSIPYSLLRPLPPNTWSASLATSNDACVQNVLA